MIHILFRKDYSNAFEFQVYYVKFTEVCEKLSSKNINSIRKCKVNLDELILCACLKFLLSTLFKNSQAHSNDSFFSGRTHNN